MFRLFCLGFEGRFLLHLEEGKFQELGLVEMISYSVLATILLCWLVGALYSVRCLVITAQAILALSRGGRLSRGVMLVMCIYLLLISLIPLVA